MTGKSSTWAVPEVADRAHEECGLNMRCYVRLGGANARLDPFVPAL